MKYYIATKLERAADHNVVRDSMARRGHELTYDWTHHGSVQREGQARISQVAELERCGVTSADLVIVLLPGGRGTHAELGIALGFGVPVLLHAPDDEPFSGAETCAFYHAAGVHRVSGPGIDALWREAERLVLCEHPGCGELQQPGMSLCEPHWDDANDCVVDGDLDTESW